MTTTHHHDEVDAVASLDAARTKRLGALLVRRKRLAVRWAEEQSHHLAGADDLAHELAVVEQALSHCYPAVFDQRFAEWVAHDAALLHAAGAAVGTCRLCMALAGGPAAA